MKEKLEHELQLAREIQQSMLPHTMPRVLGYSFGAIMQPARIVGGDFYNLFALDDERTGVVIGAVTGKGVQAALFMGLVRGLIRAEAWRDGQPGDTLRRVNRLLRPMNAAGMFVTVLYGVLDHASGGFIYARAGHELPLLLDADAAPRHVAYDSGTALGLFDELRLDEQAIAIPDGGALLLLSDGVTDAMDGAGAFSVVSVCAQRSMTRRIPRVRISASACWGCCATTREPRRSSMISPWSQSRAEWTHRLWVDIILVQLC